MRVGTLFLLLHLLLACSQVGEQTQEISQSNLSTSLDSLGRTIIAEGNILGFSVTIDSSGTSIYNGNFGYLDTSKTKAIQHDTRFDIASVSKMIGVAVIMKLVEQGKLNLDQTIEELLPDFPKKEVARKIRLRHLVSHTSGLIDNTLEVDSVFTATGITPKRNDFYNAFSEKYLLFEPETNYQYNNLGFVLMAFIAEKATNKSWQELINEMINEPTGLDFQLIKHVVDSATTSPIFNYNEGSFEKLTPWVYVMGDGGLTANSEMLSKFPRHLVQGDIILKSSLDEMVTPKQLNDGTTTGYGYGVRNGFFLEDQIIGHTGGWKSTYAIMAYLPGRDITFAGLMNTDNTPDNIYKIFTQFMTRYLGKSFPDHTKNSKKFEKPEQLLGDYHGFGDEFDNEGTTVTITMEGNQLYYCVADTCDPLRYIEDNKFWLAKYPYDYIEFEVNEKASAIREYYYGFFQVLRRRYKKQNNHQQTLK